MRSRRPLFIDTSGWMAMADSRDPAYESCRSVRDEWLRAGGTLLSTDYVMDETLPLIRTRMNLAAAGRWWDLVESSSRVRWEWIGPERMEKARSWFFRWKEQSFSFTDCTSFIVMRELRLESALATDRHFRRAGFRTLP